MRHPFVQRSNCVSLIGDVLTEKAVKPGPESFSDIAGLIFIMLPLESTIPQKSLHNTLP